MRLEILITLGTLTTSVFGFHLLPHHSSYVFHNLRFSRAESPIGAKVGEDRCPRAGSTHLFVSSPSTSPQQNLKSTDSFDISQELSLGKTLEGGETIDFSGVTTGGQSKGELALAEAKSEYVKSLSTTDTSTPPWKTEDGFVGINSEVIETVGRNIVADYTSVDVQGCASWIRSGKPSSDPSASTYEQLLEKVYKDSGDITAAFAKTFHLGTTLMEEGKRRSIWAVYVWCRRTDEIVDAPRIEGEGKDMLEELAEWEIRLERMWGEEGEVVDPLDLALLDTKISYPDLEITPFSDMVMGMLMDVPGLGRDRYTSFDELHLYCYRVAGTVGLMSTPIFGVESGDKAGMEMAKEPALSLGVAFQITNILRDVGEDAGRGRIYLPAEDMEKFGVTEEQIMNKRMTGGYKELMKYEIARARRYYRRARRGVRMLAAESRLPVQASLDCYSAILDKIEENDFDNFGKRAYVSKEEKLMTLPSSWYRCQDISKFIRLPGDPEEEE